MGEAREIEMQREKEAHERAATEALIAHERELQRLTLQNELDQKKNMSLKWRG